MGEYTAYRVYYRRDEKTPKYTKVFHINRPSKVGITTANVKKVTGGGGSTVKVLWVTGSLAGQETTERTYNLGVIDGVLEDINAKRDEWMERWGKANQEIEKRCSSTKTSLS